MHSSKSMVPFVALMTLVVAVSNYLVQFPLAVRVGPLDLADLLTWGAFTYPVAFLITDLTNRRFGVGAARFVVFCGFVIAVAVSVWLSTPRIAIASGSAFLAGQLLDVSVFNRLRRRESWWLAPLCSSVFGSILDTVLFFSLAFAPAFVVLGANDPFAIADAPVLGLLAVDAPRFVSWAIGDFSVKMIVGLAMLVPYGMLLDALRPARARSPAT